MKQIGCLHAHHSNIPLIEGILTDLPIQMSHFVDPGVFPILKRDTDSHPATDRVMNELKWIEKTGVDMILITCTNYIALLEDIKLEFHIPIMKIDEPFFEKLKQTTKPVQILFTNEGTVAGTMDRLHKYLGSRLDFPIRYEVIPKAFELYMQGKATEHDALISKALTAQNFEKNTIAVAQLSMSNEAIAYSQQTGMHIIHPLLALKNHLLSL